MLDRILQSVRAQLPAVRDRAEHLADEAAARPRPRDLAGAIRDGGLSVIAEIKRRSPSAGGIAPDLDPATLASAYAAGGAAGISVLTEPDHFGGSPADLRMVTDAVEVPVLRKDFIVDPIQVVEARAMGADAVLLIAAALDDAMLERLVATAADHGMACLVEAHDGSEVARAVVAGAEMVGINNRDLRTFEVDLDTAERLRPLIPSGVIAVAESGITTAEDARRMAAAGFDGVLVGQAAAQADDPAGFIQALRTRR